MTRILTAALGLCFFATALGLAPPAAAQTPREITWEDLLPPDEPLEDPFAHLAMDLVVKLHTIIAVREQKARGLISEVSPEYEMAVESTYELERAGVDVEAMIRDYRETEAEIRRRNQLTVDALDGQFVRLPGYALPLEHEGTAVSEFLLVPYVGACIHVPPPPANQMVFVELAEPYVAKNVFEPVWITGRMTVRRTEKSVYLTDGEAPVTSGYAVEAARVASYREQRARRE